MTSAHRSKKLSIIGGGISGLSAAYEAMQRGETDIHIYEASDRLGGKIQSGKVGSTTINKGAEFIDSDQKHMIALANALGIPLVENKGMEREEFQRADGSMMSSADFYAAYKPFAERVIADRELMKTNPNSPRAQHVNALSLDAYLDEMRATVPQPPRSFWRALIDTITFRGHPENPTLAIAAQIYASESGQPAGRISATQFIGETSNTLDSFLASDAKYRVQGGTEALITTMREKLAAGGAHFHMGAELKTIAKQTDGTLALVFNKPELNNATDRAILALPSYALSKVEGLNTLGLSKESQHLLDQNQYTKNIKLTIAFRPGMETPDAVFFSNQGFQCWSPAPGLLTVLAQADALAGQKPKDFIGERLETYAKAHGSTAAKMFDMNFAPGSFDFNNPGARPCYASPKPGQVNALESLKSELPALAKNGVGIAGTYLPYEGTIGFMECGVASAQRSVDMLIGPAKTIEQPQVQQTMSPQKWQEYVAARQVAANDASVAVAANGR